MVACAKAAVEPRPADRHADDPPDGQGLRFERMVESKEGATARRCHGSRPQIARVRTEEPADPICRTDRVRGIEVPTGTGPHVATGATDGLAKLHEASAAEHFQSR